MNRKLASLILLISLCVEAPAQVQSSSPNTNEPASGTISGKVVNENGQPMPGATTFVRAVNSLVASRTTLTDGEGNFRVTGLEPSLYTVAASAPAYTSAPSDPNEPPRYYRIGDSVNLRLLRGGVITGTVTNALGEPVIAVRVRASMVRNARGDVPRMPFFPTMEQSTDDRGIYRMYGVPPGTYLVSAGGYGVGQNFAFNPYDSDIPTFAPSSTRDNAVEVTVTGGEENDVDIRYRGETGYTISGTVKLTGIGGGSVSLTPTGGTVMPSGNTFLPPNSRGFAFHGLSDGDYDLTAQETVAGQGGAAAVGWVSEAKRVTIKGASVTGIELITKPMASVSGRIVLESSKATECQNKRAPLLAESLVQLRRPERDPDKENQLSQRVFGNSASPDANGAFVLRNLSPGKYQFDPRFYARYWYLQSITMAAAPPNAGAKTANTKIDAAANWTTIKFGEQLTNLTITLAQGAASLRGKLTATDPPSGMVLYLVSSEADKADDVLRFFVTDIAADGTFALNNLPPGKYWSLVQTSADAQTATLMKLRLPETATARTKLRKTAETQKTEIELKPCQNLTDYQLK